MYVIPRAFVRMVWAVHAIILSLIVAAPFDLWAAVLLGVLVGVNGFNFQQELNKLKKLNSISIKGSQWYLDLQGNLEPAAPHKPPLLLHWLVVIYLKADAGKWAIPIMADASNEDAFRRLRIVLNVTR